MKSTAKIFKIILPLLRSRMASVALALLALSTLNPQLSTVLAQGTAFSYQGWLSDSGSPANGSYDLTFALFDSSSAGTQAGNTITNAGLGVTNGLFTVMLDFGNQFNGTPYWLEVGVRASGGGAFTTLSPRQELTPTPYALFAPSAGTAAIAAVANSTAPNAVNGASLQSNSITTDKILAGAITDADISPGGISGNKIIGGDLQAQRLMVGASHTLTGQFATIAGGFQNTISDAGWSVDAIGGGNLNQINSAGDAAIAGGYGNGISNSWASTVGGGNGNLVTGQSAATIGGGGQNQIVGAGAATIAGGYQNAISNAAFSADAIGGGQGNQIRSAGSAAIAGGSGNTVSNSWAATVAGGAGNLVAGSGNAAIGSGLNNNIINAWCGTTPGGRSNQVGGAYGFAAGYRAKANHPGAFVWGDSAEADFASSGNDQFLIRAAGGVGIGKTNPATALDVNGTVSATAFVGNGAGLTNLSGGTPANTPGAIVQRDASGNFSAGTITLSGDLALPLTASSSVGVLSLGGMPFLHGYGWYNSFVGPNAGNFTMTGVANTAAGAGALFSNTSGYQNTASGFNALLANTTGSQNTANGLAALHSNTTGSQNTANGFDALYSNANGSQNTANGAEALYSNTSGPDNTANGFDALHSNTSGDWNTAIGGGALNANTTGHDNTAIGAWALHANTTGFNNVAIGDGAGQALTTGDNNIAVGTGAGQALTTDCHNNIDIGNDGVASDGNTIRIGSQATHMATYIGGIYGRTASGGSVVYINSSGLLGTYTSSKRFKEAIADIGDQSDVLLSLRPVSFHFKPDIDPQGLPQFGLIAEEVEQVAPSLVVRDDKGAVYSVRYEQVNAMLLNEFLKEHRKVEAQGDKIQALEQSVAELKSLVKALADKSNGGAQ